ncbi:MAG TPA: PEGA domain-containing protein [Sedimentisphaerales bacterium]|nr:PEGA domain-containing protein [Sedimentisphaerales bacterium]HRS10429.1 PEGA domain-containing protein [Sedimentisphaerales bacterium]HRV47134.1 PEGA domain-containing protein [Sedimentisphaerales bacterium]
MNTHSLLFVTAASLGAVLLCGCVERKLTINTEPQGALITLNDEQIGVSPVTVSFNWYGDYWVRASKEGFETLDTHRELRAPLHDRFPFDFFAGVLYPGRITDDYEWTFELAPRQDLPRDQLLEQADALRTQME